MFVTNGIRISVMRTIIMYVHVFCCSPLSLFFFREKELWDQKIKAREQAAKERHDVAKKCEIEYEQKLRNEVDK